jgi:hypothetical protein
MHDGWAIRTMNDDERMLIRVFSGLCRTRISTQRPCNACARHRQVRLPPCSSASASVSATSAAEPCNPLASHSAGTGVIPISISISICRPRFCPKRCEPNENEQPVSPSFGYAALHAPWPSRLPLRVIACCAFAAINLFA